MEYYVRLKTQVVLLNTKMEVHIMEKLKIKKDMDKDA